MAPRPIVVINTKKNPRSIVFLVPIEFLIIELKGLKRTCAKENAAMMIEMFVALG